MTEREFDLMLDDVRDAVAAPSTIIGVHGSTFDAIPMAANDNILDDHWPMVPFPAGWHASC